jgi:hypothetical protein
VWRALRLGRVGGRARRHHGPGPVGRWGPGVTRLLRSESPHSFLRSSSSVGAWTTHTLSGGSTRMFVARRNDYWLRAYPRIAALFRCGTHCRVNGVGILWPAGTTEGTVRRRCASDLEDRQ